MWSLPEINRLNANAAANAKKLRREAAGKRKPNCEIHGCTCRASQSTLWYDIFSDDPKGVIHTCVEHTAEDDPELFRCENCERVMLDHYTHERYRVELHGDVLCLKCAADRYFDIPRHWIEPQNVKRVVLKPGEGELFNTTMGVLNIAHCPHVLGVKQPLPAGIELYDNAEFDSCDGRQISGYSLLDIVRRLDQPFCPVLDATYQFAVSVGIYVRSENQEQEVA